MEMMFNFESLLWNKKSGQQIQKGSKQATEYLIGASRNKIHIALKALVSGLVRFP